LHDNLLARFYTFEYLPHPVGSLTHFHWAHGYFVIAINHRD
jgi:hypothetical protein